MLKSIVSTLFTVLLAGSAIGQQSLGFDLREGDVFTVEQRASQEVSQQFQQGEHKLTNSISAVLEFRVTESRDTTFLLECTFRDLFFKIESSSQGKLLDIRARELDKSDLQSRVFHSLIGIPVEIEMNRMGQILKVRGGDSLVNRMMASTGLEDGPERSLLRESLEQEYSSEALAGSFRQMTYFYPAGRVRIGDSWKNRHEGRLAAVNTWTLDTLAEGSARISGEARIRLVAGNAGDQMQLEGEQEMLLVTEAGSGFISKLEVSGTASGSTLEPGAGITDIPTQIRTQCTYTLIDHKHVQ